MERRRFLKTLGAAAAFQAHAGSGRAFPVKAPEIVPDRGPKFLFNQLGYLPLAEKVATVRGADTTESRFRVRSTENGQVVLEGNLTVPQFDTDSGDTVSQADFSALQRQGQYSLAVGTHSSDPFSIRHDIYAHALRLTMRAYCGQRCGCIVDLGSGYRHPPCHGVGDYHPSSGRTGPILNAGGWHDAGDYGRYVVNSGITCGTLLWAWELHEEPLRELDLAIPKPHGRLPDFLAEVLWNLDWMLALQDDDGGVFHKQTSADFCAFIMPQDDRLASEVIGTGSKPYKSTCATADFAAVTAIAARCYAEFDRTLSQRFLTAAERAWQWVMAHPDVAFENPPGVTTGAYGDKHCSDEILWASAELWRTTGEPKYEKAFADAMASAGDFAIEAPSWGSVAPMACWTYALSPRPGDPRLKAIIKDRTNEAAAELIKRSGANGYGNTMRATDYGWGSNSVAANQSMLLSIADHFQPNPAARTAALNNLHYLLGRNCHDISWVTQLGRRPFLHPHHRPSAADGIDEPWPGLLSGGPNMRPGDVVARTLARQPPMRMWLDDQRAYSLNEVAINWNAPLVFLLAFANRIEKRASFSG